MSTIEIKEEHMSEEFFEDDGQQLQPKIETQDSDSGFGFLSHILHQQSDGTAEEVDANKRLTDLNDINNTSTDESEQQMHSVTSDQFDTELEAEGAVITAHNREEDITLSDIAIKSEDIPNRAKRSRLKLDGNEGKDGPKTKEAPVNETTIVKAVNKPKVGHTSGGKTAATKNEPIICPFTDCNLKLDSQEVFRQHLDQFHNRFGCTKCSAKFPTEEQLEKHALKSHPIGVLRKSVRIISMKANTPCVKGVASAQTRPVGVSNATRFTLAPRGVTPVQKIAGTTSNAQTTMTSADGNRLIYFPVNACGVGPQSQNSFVKGKKIAPRPKRVATFRSYGDNKCNTCGQVFPSNDHLETHLEFFDTRRITLKELICFECHKIFQGQALIKEHMAKSHLQLPDDDQDQLMTEK